MDINFSVTAFPGITDSVIFRAYETTAPNTLVADSGFYAAPHGSPRNIVIAGVNPVPHIIKMYQVPGEIGTGTLIKEFWIDPNSKSYEGEKVLFFVVDRGNTYDPDIPGSVTDPVSGTNTIEHPLLEGLDEEDYTVERRGFGTLLPTDFVADAGAGSFELALTGDQWQEGEVIVVRIPGEFSNNTSTTTSNAVLFTGIEIIEEDTTLTTDQLRKMISLEAATNVITVTLDILSNVPNNSIIGFVTHTGAQANAIIKGNGSELIKFNKDEVNQVIMGAGEELWLSKKDTRWYVIKSSAGMFEVGQILYAHSLLPNTLKCEGQLLNREDYPRLWAYINSLSSNEVVTDAAWLATTMIAKSDVPGNIGYGLPTNVTVRLKDGCFSTGDSSSTFRLPDLRDKFLRGLQASDADRSHNYAGGYQLANVGEHEHAVAIRADNSALAYNTRTIAARAMEDFSGGAGNFTVVHLTDKAVGNETRPGNIGLHALIKI